MPAALVRLGYDEPVAKRQKTAATSVAQSRSLRKESRIFTPFRVRSCCTTGYTRDDANNM